MNLITKKKLLNLLHEYAKEKCTEHCGDGDDCPFNDGETEGMHWCAFDSLLDKLGEETGQGQKISDDFADFQHELREKEYAKRRGDKDGTDY